METYDIDKAIEAQRKFCKENELPNFAGNGRCFSCGRNVYGDGGYSVEYASQRLVTGCPYCLRSFCD